MPWHPKEDSGVTSPLGTALTIGIVILMAVGLSFMVRIFMDRGEDPQALATFDTNEVEDSLRVRRAEAEVLRSAFEVRLSVAGDFDVVQAPPGGDALPANRFVALGGADDGPSDGPMEAGTVFYFCAAGAPAQNVQVEIRHRGSNSVIWRDDFADLAACP